MRIRPAAPDVRGKVRFLLLDFRIRQMEREDKRKSDRDRRMEARRGKQGVR